MKRITIAFACLAVGSIAHAQDYVGGAPYYVQKHNSIMAAPTDPGPAPTRAKAIPHHYAVKRNGQYGYTDSVGQVHFFGNPSHNDKGYQIVSFDAISSGVIRCTDDCSIVDVYGPGGLQTFQPQEGTVLWAVVQDMVSGALQ